MAKRKRKRATPAFVTRRNADGIGNRKPSPITGPTPSIGFEEHNEQVKMFDVDTIDLDQSSFNTRGHDITRK